MKRIILHINILLILLALTSFDEEKENHTISNFYNLNEIALNNIVVTKNDQIGNTSYLHYGKNGQLQRIELSENSYKTFSYNTENKLIETRLYKNNKVYDKETISYHQNKIIKTDYDVEDNNLVESFKEEYGFNAYNQISEIKSYKKTKNQWNKIKSSVVFNWNINKIESIESVGYNSQNSLIEKLDFFNDLEYTKPTSSSKKHVLQVSYSHNIDFSPNQGNLFDINSLINNKTSSFYVSSWNKGNKKEVIRYKLNTDVYPILLEIKTSKANQRSYRNSYSIELI